MAYIYLLSENGDNNLVKIGVTTSKDINKRIKKLQTGNGNEIILLDYFETDDAFKIEKMLHNHFKEAREEGEWFLLSNEQIASFKTQCEYYQKIMDSLNENPLDFEWRIMSESL